MKTQTNASISLQGKKPTLIILLVVALYLVFGIYTQLKLLDAKPLPAKLHYDFKIYQKSLFKALEGEDPYAERRIGSDGYLYPTPSLFFVETFAHISDPYLQVAVFTVVHLLLMGALIYGISQKYNCSLRSIWWWFPLGFGFAPFLEILTVGQINLIAEFSIWMMFLLETSSPFLSGIFLSFGVITKVTPLFFLGYLVANRNLKVVGGSLVGILALIMLSAIRYGYESEFKYLQVFRELAATFPMGENSQSLVAKLVSYGLINPTQTVATHNMLMIYLLFIFAIGAFCCYLLREREPLFIIVNLGMMLSPNQMWYHHYIFFLIPLFVWMGWSKLRPSVVLWCFTGFIIIQLDRFLLTHGLIIHLFGHISILAVLVPQVKKTSCLIRTECGSSSSKDPTR